MTPDELQQLADVYTARDCSVDREGNLTNNSVPDAYQAGFLKALEVIKESMLNHPYSYTIESLCLQSRELTVESM